MNITTLLNKKNLIYLAIILLVEVFSFIAYLYPGLAVLFFIVIAGAAAVLTIEKLEYGVLLLATELFIGSMGHIFEISIYGFELSMRMAIWAIVMLVWIISSIYRKELVNNIVLLNLRKYRNQYLLLFFFIGIGFLVAILNSNFPRNVLFDMNGWIYFTIIFPFATLMSTKNIVAKLVNIIFVATSWLSLKTFILLYIFSHNFIPQMQSLYSWLRQSGLAEITNISGGYYRIFFQSHIFILLAFFIMLFYFIEYLRTKKQNRAQTILYFSFLSIYLAVIILCFSRSIWFGFLVGLLFGVYYLAKNRNWKRVIKGFSYFVVCSFFSLIIILAIVKFPFPNPTGGFNPAELLAKRANILDADSAISSRWTLLPALWTEIMDAPIFGRGFGYPVSYISSDPRVLQDNPSGQYSSYAFEWGWLSIWLKLGLFGLIAYLVYIISMITDMFRSSSILANAFAVSIIVLVITNFFTPYLDHPLGISMLIISSMVAVHFGQSRSVIQKQK